MKQIIIMIFLMLCVQHMAQAQTKKSTRIKTANVYVTAENTDMRLTKTLSPPFGAATQPFENEVCIFVDTLSKFQKLLGIGGAFTDASAETFYKLSPEKQKELIRMYFDEKDGIGYSFGRANMNSCTRIVCPD